ncbi:hypothetical protein ACFQZC_27945 [Streptacidiphilus monticola]
MLAKLPTHAGTSEELFALADAIGAVTGGAVAIEDLEHRVLAYSTLPGQEIDEHRRRGILNRRVPTQPEQLPQYREVLAAPGVVRLPTLADDELPRAAVAIRAGEMPLGTIWAIEGASPIDAAGERALLEGARLAALHMLRRRSAAELDVQAREDALRAALRGRRTAREVRFELGLPGRRPLVLIGFAPVASASGDGVLMRLGAEAARHWAAVHAEASVATAGRTVYALVPLEESPPRRRPQGGSASRRRPCWTAAWTPRCGRRSAAWPPARRTCPNSGRRSTTCSGSPRRTRRRCPSPRWRTRTRGCCWRMSPTSCPAGPDCGIRESI